MWERFGQMKPILKSFREKLSPRRLERRSRDAESPSVLQSAVKEILDRLGDEAVKSYLKRALKQRTSPDENKAKR